MSDCASDASHLEPDLQSVPATLGQPERVLADCGYVDKEVFPRLGEQHPGLDLYVSVHREDAHAERHYDFRPAQKVKKLRVLNDPVLVAMAEKLRTTAGRAAYRLRTCTVQPVFGVIKAGLGFRQFRVRGWERCAGKGRWCAWPTT